MNLSRRPYELSVVERDIAAESRATVRRVCAAVILGILVALLLPAPAQAHAATVATTPAAGTVVGVSPTAVTVTFSEPVTIVPGRIQVLAPDGERISNEPRAIGNVLEIPVRRAERPLGTYLVSFRIVSADSHPVAGGFTFSVGAPSTPPVASAADAVHPSVTVAVAAGRYLGYAGLVLAIGPALLLTLLWPRQVPRRGAIRLVGAGLGLIAASAVAAIWLQAPYGSGRPAYDVTAAQLTDVLTSGFGGWMVLRLAAVAGLALLLPPMLRGQGGRVRGGRVRRWTLAAVAPAGLATWPLTGHAAASPLPPVGIVADIVHIAAMSVWLGGLVVLAVVLLRRAHPRTLGVILPVWSRWAAISVVWLVGAGLVQAVSEVGAPSALVGTAYGRVLLAKAGLLVAVLAAAAYARRLVQRRAVPVDGEHRLRRTVGLEVTATALVLALSAVLVQVTPARSAAAAVTAADAKGASGTLTSPLYTLQYDIYPGQIGENNTVHAALYTAQGAPLPAAEWQVTTVLPEKGIEPVTLPMLDVPPNHAIGALTFPVPGTWEVRFTVRTTEVDQATVRTTVTVR